MSKKTHVATILRLRGVPKVTRNREEKTLQSKSASWLKDEVKRLKDQAKASDSGSAKQAMPEVKSRFASYNDNRCSRDEWSQPAE